MKKSINIIGPYKPYLGGATKHIVELSNIFNKNSIDVEVFVNRTPPSQKTNYNLSVNYIGKNIINLVTLFFSIKKHSLVNFHVSNNIFLASLVLFLCKIRRLKLIITFHSGKSKKYLNNLFGRLIIKFSHKIILIGLYDKNFNYNNVEFISPIILKNKKIKKNNSKKLTFCSSGMYKKLYNHLEIIEFLINYSNQIKKNIILNLFISTTFKNDELRWKIFKKSKEIHKYFILKIFENNDDLITKFNKSEYFIRSTNYDSFGISIIEAYLAGCKIISSNIENRIPIGNLYTIGNQKSFINAIEKYPIDKIIKNESFFNKISNEADVLKIYE